MENKNNQLPCAVSAFSKASVAKLMMIPLLLLINTAYCAEFIPTTFACFGDNLSFFTEFGQPILAVFGLMVALISFSYMAGKSWNKPELLVWSKVELGSLLWSVLIAIAIMGSLGLSCTLSNLLLTGNAPQPGVDGAYSPNVLPSQIATRYIDSLLDTYGASLASEILRSSIEDQLGTTGYAYWSIAQYGGGGLSFNANKFAWSAHKELLADIYLPLASMLMAQKMIFEILMPGILGVIIPAAILFRSLFLTRDVGNLMLAFSLAVFFAIPLTYVFFFDATANMQQNIFTGATFDRPFGADFNLAYDDIIGSRMLQVGFFATQAILPLNIALVVVTALTMALSKAFKGMVG